MDREVGLLASRVVDGGLLDQLALADVQAHTGFRGFRVLGL